MYSKTKFLIISVSLFLFTASAFPQYFTSSGPTTATIPFGQQNAQATFYFTYNLGGTNMVLPKLAIEVDGELIAGALCQGSSSFTPSSYTITLSPGNHTIKFTLNSLGEYEPCHESAITWQQNQHSINTNFKIRIENNPSGGSINVDNVQRTSPYNRTATQGDNFSIGAIDQSYGGNNLIWNASGVNNSKWEKKYWGSNPQFYSNNRNTSYPVQSNDQSTTLIANLKKVYNITFSNQLTGSGQTGQMNINGNTVSAPTTPGVVEQNSILVGATGYYDFGGNVYYIFDRWSDGNTNLSRSITATQTANYTAIYKAYPKFSEGQYRNLVITGVQQGNFIHLDWDEHPNTSVTQYHVYRRSKSNGTYTNPELLAAVNRGTTSLTDWSYTFTPSGNALQLEYDVRAYYSPDQTLSTWNFVVVTGYHSNQGWKLSAGSNSNQIIKEYSIVNYPNPFNPTTQIDYAIKADGFVSIKVYDLLGNEITTLVNEPKAKGYYSAEFNAANLPSGVYIYSINVNDYSATKKMILTK